MSSSLLGRLPIGAVLQHGIENRDSLVLTGNPCHLPLLTSRGCQKDVTDFTGYLETRQQRAATTVVVTDAKTGALWLQMHVEPTLTHSNAKPLLSSLQPSRTPRSGWIDMPRPKHLYVKHLFAQI